MMNKKVICVRDVMKTEFDIVDGMDTVANALCTMRHVETKTLIVKKRHEDDEYGMLLVSDIARHVLAMDRAPERVNVYEIMTRPVLSVAHEMDVRYCARLFTQFHLSRAPVIENREIIGIISLTDIALRGLCKVPVG